MPYLIDFLVLFSMGFVLPLSVFMTIHFAGVLHEKIKAKKENREPRSNSWGAYPFVAFGLPLCIAAAVVLSDMIKS
jgi:hypothetical protein